MPSGPRGGADRLGEHRRRRPRRLPRLPGRRRRVRRTAATRRSPRTVRGAPTRHRDHRQLPRHLGRRATSTRPTTSPSAGPSSTRCGTPATGGSSTSSSPTASSRGAACRRCGRSARPRPRHAVDTTDTFDAGVESLKAHAAYIDGLGWENFDPREMLEGFGRQAGQRLGRGLRGTVRGVPDGLGRVAAPAEMPNGRRPKTRPFCSCSPGWTRTNNPPVNSRMLCQLSYRGSCDGNHSKAAAPSKFTGQGRAREGLNGAGD